MVNLMASRTPIMHGTTRVIFVTAVAVLLAACTAALKAVDLNKEISAELQSKFDVEAVVECPDDIEAKKGGSFACTARDEKDNSLSVQVTQSDDQGNVEWSMDTFNLPVIEEELAPEVSRSVDVQVTIECPRILVSSDVGSSLDCSVTDENGGEGILRVTSVDGKGNFDWKLNP